MIRTLSSEFERTDIKPIEMVQASKIIPYINIIELLE